MQSKVNIKTYSTEELENLTRKMGQPIYRARQIVEWLYSPKQRLTSFMQMSNLPLDFREQLEATHTLNAPVVLERLVSKDGSRKYLLQLHDGALIETVALPSKVPSKDRSDAESASVHKQHKRLTVCFSSQSGCAMGCTFCATAKLGLTRSLTPSEMADQLIVVAEDFAGDTTLTEESASNSANACAKAFVENDVVVEGRQSSQQEYLRISNVVAMGQGEPFANYDATLAALRLMNNPRLFGIGSRHITLSTCGIISGIRKLASEPEQFTLAVSLHSATQSTRDILMPGVSGQPLNALQKALCEYASITGRRPSLECSLIANINDTDKELQALINFAKSGGFHVNLIPLNTQIESSNQKPRPQTVPSKNKHNARFTPSSPQKVMAFAKSLRTYGIETSIRASRGSDIQGACGQLAGSI